MRKTGLAILAALAVPATALAAPPSVKIRAGKTVGAAPLTVSLRATGVGLTSFTWTFGDGSRAKGERVRHTYRAGRYTARVVATSADGRRVRSRISVRALAIRLRAPRTATYGSRVVLRGRAIGALPGRRVLLSSNGVAIASVRTTKTGGFRKTIRLRAPGPYRARIGEATSRPLVVRVRPTLEAKLVGPAVVGAPLAVRARLEPGRAGTIRVTVFRGERRTLAKGFPGRALVRLGTSGAHTFRVRVSVIARRGFATPHAQVLRATLRPPRLAVGSSGPAVAELARRLRQLRYVVPSNTSTYSYALLDSVYAFQKVQGISRDGIVDVQTWGRLARPYVPRPRYSSPADHLEIDKSRQVLYVVRGGEIAHIISVSTAGIPGWFTPEGHFSIYRKVGYWDPSPLGVLYKPMYFTGGYAVHGSPSVPPYPASHGCVRTPLWLTDWLYATNDYGESVFVYS